MTTTPSNAEIERHRARPGDAAPWTCRHLRRPPAVAPRYWLPDDDTQHLPAGFYCRACCALHLAQGSTPRSIDA